MKTLSRGMMKAAFGAAISATLLAPFASAGCATTDLQGPVEYRQLHVNSAPAPENAQSTLKGARGLGPVSIVGMWKIELVSKGNTTHNPPIPDGALLDFGYSQWHSDGTEILNSGGRAPATENFCLGVWQKTGHATYLLTHLALSYDAATGRLNGKSLIREEVTLSPGGTMYAGTFTIDAFDPAMGSHVDHIEGEVNAERVTVDTTAP
jgi:hypothetical protein